MKILKIAVIALVVAVSSFSAAKAQVVVKARIGSGPAVYHEPVRRPVHRRVYHRRAVVVREPVVYHRRRPVHYHRSRPVVVVRDRH